MADWQTISSLATAGGTPVLPGPPLLAVPSSHRSARTAEQSLLARTRPPRRPWWGAREARARRSPAPPSSGAGGRPRAQGRPRRGGGGPRRRLVPPTRPPLEPRPPRPPLNHSRTQGPDACQWRQSTMESGLVLQRDDDDSPVEEPLPDSSTSVSSSGSLSLRRGGPRLFSLVAVRG